MACRVGLAGTSHLHSRRASHALTPLGRRPRRSVRAIQLPSRPLDDFPSSSNASPGSPAPQALYGEAYARGYEEGLRAAMQLQQQMAGAGNGASASAAAPTAASSPQPATQLRPGAAAAAAAAAANPCQDTMLRSAVKGLSWRVFGMAITLLLAWACLGRSCGGGGGGVGWRDMAKFGAAEFVVKYLSYFVHERIWACIRL